MKYINTRVIKLSFAIVVLQCIIFSIKFALRDFMPSPNFSVTESRINKHTHYISNKTKYFTKAKFSSKVNYSNNSQHFASLEPKVLGENKNKGGQGDLALIQFIFGDSFKDIGKNITTPLKFGDRYDKPALAAVNNKSRSYERNQFVFNLTKNLEKIPQNVRSLHQDDIEIYGMLTNG